MVAGAGAAFAFTLGVPWRGAGCGIGPAMVRGLWCAESRGLGRVGSALPLWEVVSPAGVSLKRLGGFLTVDFRGC